MNFQSVEPFLVHTMHNCCYSSSTIPCEHNARQLIFCLSSVDAILTTKPWEQAKPRVSVAILSCMEDMYMCN